MVNCVKQGHICPEIYKALDGILFIAEHKKRNEESTKVDKEFVKKRLMPSEIYHILEMCLRLKRQKYFSKSDF